MADNAFDPATTVVSDIKGDYTLDPTHSRLGVSTRHAMVTTVRGQFKDFSGEAVVDTAEPAASRVEVTIQAASVDTGVADRDGHLRSPDFFDAAKFPQIGFKSSDCTMHQGRVASARGELTIRGVSRPVTLKANVFKCAPHPMMQKKACGGDFETSIRRSEFDMKYGLPDLGDQVKLRIGIEAVKD